MEGKRRESKSGKKVAPARTGEKIFHTPTASIKEEDPASSRPVLKGIQQSPLHGKKKERETIRELNLQRIFKGGNRVDASKYKEDDPKL